MKKWAGSLLILGLAVILLIRYGSMEKPLRKQSAFDFFNNHPPSVNVEDYLNDIGDGNEEKTPPKKDVDYSSFKEKPRFVDFDGLGDLYSLSNVSEEESGALLVWSQMRALLSRSDALPETAQGIKEAAVAWKELLSVIRKDKALNVLDEKEDKDCPYSVSLFNGRLSRDGSILEIPCGLIEDSSITVIGIPDSEKESFQINLVGSQLPKDPNPPIVLHYNVVLPGVNLTKDPIITQNTWTNASGWGKEEKCPDHGFSDTLKVDGLARCNTKIIRSNREDTSNASHLESVKLANASNGTAHASANFPFVEGYPFTATLWAGVEGFHMTVNGRHETSFAYREKLEPWLVNEVRVEGSLGIISTLAKGLPVSQDPNLADIEHLKAPSISLKKRLILLIGVFSTGNNFERRMALRRSWMQYEAVRSGQVAVRFFIGLVSEALAARGICLM